MTVIETNAEPSQPAATLSAPVGRRSGWQWIWLGIDWSARIALIFVVIWGTWHTLNGVNQLLRSSHLPARQMVAEEELRAQQAVGAIDSWTAPGRWVFFRPGEKLKSSQIAESLVPLPADAHVIARRVGQDKQILVEFFSTRQTLPQLDAFWRQAKWNVSALPVQKSADVHDTGQIPGYHLERDSDAVLVWTISQKPGGGPLTIACSRTSRQESTRVSPQ